MKFLIFFSDPQINSTHPDKSWGLTKSWVFPKRFRINKINENCNIINNNNNNTSNNNNYNNPQLYLTWSWQNLLSGTITTTATTISTVSQQNKILEPKFLGHKICLNGKLLWLKTFLYKNIHKHINFLG